MKKISTPYTFSLKIMPWLYFGFVAIFGGVVLMGGAIKKDPLFVFVPFAMAIGGYYFFRVALRNLADEVYDCGDFLLVRKGGNEDRVPLANIINVNFAMNIRPARITLTLATPGKFGREIVFALPPKLYFSPLPTSELAADLIARAHTARLRRAN
jgi:hypothetical protein